MIYAPVLHIQLAHSSRSFPILSTTKGPCSCTVLRSSIDRTPHCCRHTCISMLAEAGVDPTTVKKIVGHSGAMTVTERIYTHLDIQFLVESINKI